MGLQMKDKKNLIPLRGRQQHARAPQSNTWKIWSIIGRIMIPQIGFLFVLKKYQPISKNDFNI